VFLGANFDQVGEVATASFGLCAQDSMTRSASYSGIIGTARAFGFAAANSAGYFKTGIKPDAYFTDEAKKESKTE